MPTFDPQSQVAALQELKAGGMDLNKIIAHVVGNSESLEPLRKKAGQLQIDIENEGKNIIDAMAAKQTAEAAVAQVENAAKLKQEQLALERQRQIGVDIQNPGSDRLAKLAAWMEEESNTHRASVEKIQQLDAVNFVDNPIQYIINQYKIASEKDTAETALKARQAYGAEMAQLHTLAQENVQTVVNSKLAKTNAELQATLDNHAAAAAELAAKQRAANAGQNLNATMAILNMNEQQHNVHFKVMQLKKDADDRERNARQDELRYKMLELQFGEAIKSKEGKEALVKDMRRHFVEMGGNQQQAEAIPEEAILGHKGMQASYLQNRGLGGALGPYTAVKNMKSVVGADNHKLQTPTAAWINNTYESLTLPVTLQAKRGAMAEEEIEKWYNDEITSKAKAAYAGDHDASIMLRVPPIGVLRNIDAVKNNYLFRKYLTNAADSDWNSAKQLAGFILKDPKMKTEGNYRARVIKDFTNMFQAIVNYRDAFYEFKALGLPPAQGYLIQAEDLLNYENAGLPDNLKRRRWDLTKEGDVQALFNTAIGRGPGLFGTDFGSILRQDDNTSKAARGDKKPTKDKKGKE